MWIIFALLSAVFAALVAIFGKLGLERIDPTLAATVRALIMAGFMIVAALVIKGGELGSITTFTSREWLYIIFAGLAGALSWLFYFIALSQGDANNVAALDRLSIVFIVILAAFFLGESLTIPAIIGALLVAIGAGLIVFF